MLQPTTVQATPAKRRGRWKPGESGNPLGKPRHVLPDGKSVREHAREATPEALALLKQCMRDEDQPMQLRIDAARAILRTGHADVVRGDASDDTSVVVQVVSYDITPPAGGVPGVLNHPDPRFIHVPSLRPGEVINTEVETT